MLRIYLIAVLAVLVPLANEIYAKSVSNKFVHDSNADEISVAKANELNDENILITPKVIKQTITVNGHDSDISGFTSRAIQIAVDALKLHGGGTVELRSGTYKILAPIKLASNISLIGAGESTVLRKIDGCRSPLVSDADYPMVKVQVLDVRGFSQGMGVQISDSQYSDDWDVTAATIVAIDGNTIFIDQCLKKNYVSEKSILSSACSIVEGIEVENVHVANFVVEGNKATNDLLGNCIGSAIYFFKAVGCSVENVKVKDFNGDAFGWQTTKDITVRNCEASYCTDIGFHPGTGSENTLIEGCRSHHNAHDGIFLCWKVKKSMFRNNSTYDNDRDGISINKKDTDNVFANNRIYKNGRNGVWFNDYGEPNDNSPRNLFVKNVIEDNGRKERGCGFYIDSNIRDIVIRNNIIRDSGKGTQKCAVFIGNRASNVQVIDNTMSGHSDGDIMRK
jgi:hypothetical protein